MQIPKRTAKEHSNRDGCIRLGIPIAAFLALLHFTAIFFILISWIHASNYGFACSPDGSVRFPWSEEVRVTWQLSQLLSVTLGFGNFTFAEAKAIDFAWDLIVGRGGQALLALACYPVFRRAFLLSIETRTASFPIFSAIAFEKVSLTSIWVFIQDIWACPRSRKVGTPVVKPASIPRQFLLVLICAFAYILSFPTWLSGMTSYQSKMGVYFTVPLNGNLAPASNLTAPDAVLIDGSRVGLSNNQTVFKDSQEELYKTLNSCMHPLHCPQINLLTLCPSQDQSKLDDIIYNGSSGPCSAEKFMGEWSFTDTTTVDPRWWFDVSMFCKAATAPHTYGDSWTYVQVNSSITINDHTWILHNQSLKTVLISDKSIS